MNATAKPAARKQTVEDLFRNARDKIVGEIIQREGTEQEVNLVAEYNRSSQLLGSYVTLDWPHYLAIKRIRNEISQYAADRSRRRPLNIIMQAEPGSGKSHLVKNLAASIAFHNAVAIDYNMASLQRVEDLLQPLDAVRNIKVQDRLPILFLDEFDSDAGRYPLLLPLLWDGELNVGHRNLKLGKLVVILAGSGTVIRTAMEAAKGMQGEVAAEHGKLIDLLSRINGGELEIPPMDLVEDGRDRRVDKVCMTISLLQARFGTNLELVPLSLLRFASTTTFRYGVRSLAHLIDIIQPFAPDARERNELSSNQLSFPLESAAALRKSSLAYHVYSEDGAAAIVDHWKEVSADEATVRIHDKIEEDDIPFWEIVRTY